MGWAPRRPGPASRTARTGGAPRAPIGSRRTSFVNGPSAVLGRVLRDPERVGESGHRAAEEDVSEHLALTAGQAVGVNRLCGRQTVLARVEGGQLAEVWFLPDDQAAFDAFFTEAGAPVLSEPAAPGLRYRD